MEAAENLAVPTYYVLSRTATEEQIDKALSALSITPIQAAFCTDFGDDELAQRFSPCLLYAVSEETAAMVARALLASHPYHCLIISSGDFSLDAVYEDGRREHV